MYRDKLKQMAELNEVFIFNKDLHKMLPIQEGRISIYGVNPSSIFNEGEGPGIFKRDTMGSNQRSMSVGGFNGQSLKH